MKVVSSARIQDSLQRSLLSQFPQVSFSFFNNMDEVGSALEDAEVLITYGEDLTPDLIKQAKVLKWIMVISAGLDKMPFREIKEKGIVVTNCKGIHAKPMAEYTIGMMLQVARKAKELAANQEQHIWDRRVPMMELNGKTIGILGIGAIGQEIARLAKAFQMKTLGMNTSGKEVEYVDKVYTFAEVADLLQQSDFIVNVLPSTNKTENFINEERISFFKKDSIFINIGRGSTVDEQALISGLETNHINHAVLDVFQEEPLPADSIFWDMDHVTVSPHLSGISSLYQLRAIEIVIENMKRYLDSNVELYNRIDLDKGY